MRLIPSLIGILIPSSAHALTLETAGAGGPGVSTMWSAICSVVYCSVPGGPVLFFTGKIVSFVFPLIGAFAVLLIIYAGLRLITGEGKEDSLSKAKEIIFYALLGVGLALISSAVILFVADTLLPTLLS